MKIRVLILTIVGVFCIGISYSFCAEPDGDSAPNVLKVPKSSKVHNVPKSSKLPKSHKVPKSRKLPKAHNVSKLFRGSSFSTQLQTDMQYCLPDSVGDKSPYVGRFLSNSFLDAGYTSSMLELGARLEVYENPLPGFEAEYKGWGVPYFYLKLKLGAVELTAGDFYEQFGSGMILRSYYERSLGIDNALRGGRIVAQPARWLSLKALAGRQRYYWKRSDTWVGGADVEMNFDQLFESMADKGHYLQWGASWVSKWEPFESIPISPSQQLNLPSAVASFASRIRYQNSNFTLQGEYAYKFNDPSFENNYTFRPGQALVLNASYSVKGFGITAGAKHSDNMSLRSARSEGGRMLQINFLPAFTYQHTYSLAAMYPYATQSSGEVAFQVDVFYKIPKKSLLGGKYGTDIRANFSHVNSLKKIYNVGVDASMPGTYGYKTALFSIGDQTYYQDFNIDISHRFNRGFKLSALYINQTYNQAQIQGHGTRGDIVYSNIFVVEGTFRLSDKLSLRTEAQYLSTRQDNGDWLAGVAELTISPSVTITASNLYNVGLTRKNYFLGSIAYSVGIYSLQLSVGQQRAGITCVGGVCRYVPEANGASISYTVNLSTR